MKPQRSRRLVPLFVAGVLGSVGLLAAGTASADKALFRAQRAFLGAPFPGVPGNAGTLGNDPGRSIITIEPYKPTTANTTGTSSYPGFATVTPGNAVGAKFTLQSSFIDYQGTFTLFPSTAFNGYLSQSILDYRNGEARFGPSNPNGATTSTTVTFGQNYPTGTTTFGGNFDFSRNGFLKINPGPNKFGGTMRYLHAPTAEYYQYRSINAPLFFKGYGSFGCTKMGVTCTAGFDTTVGEATSSGGVAQYLLSPTIVTNTVTPTPRFGKTQYRNIAASSATSRNYYLHLNAPWTTGTASAFNSVGVTSGYGVNPKAKGYDKVFSGGTDITLTRTYTAVSYKGMGKTYYPTAKYYTKLTGVTRAVSLVKPRLTHTYQIPRLPTDPIFSNFQANRVQIMKVFFLPEPASMLLIASGVVGLAGLALLRRR